MGETLSQGLPYHLDTAGGTSLIFYCPLPPLSPRKARRRAGSKEASLG